MAELSLLVSPPEAVALFIDLFIFFSYVVLAFFLVYVGKTVHYKGKVTLPWIILAIGLIFTSINLFVEAVGIITGIYVLPRPVLWYIFNTVGSIALIVGFTTAMTERQVELSVLKRRQLEIKDIMEYLKERYYKRELSEKELRRIYSNLVEHLAEIEVRIKRLEKERKRKKE